MMTVQVNRKRLGTTIGLAIVAFVVIATIAANPSWRSDWGDGYGQKLTDAQQAAFGDWQDFEKEQLSTSNPPLGSPADDSQLLVPEQQTTEAATTTQADSPWGGSQATSTEAQTTETTSSKAAATAMAPSEHTDPNEHTSHDDHTHDTGSQTPMDAPETFHEIRSSKFDGAYWPIYMGNRTIFNPNMIPHPTKDNTWITASQDRPEEFSVISLQVHCNATMHTDGTIRCDDEPAVIPVVPTRSEHCEGEIAGYNMNTGPHDARVFWGPDQPFILYGTQSHYTCFGIYVQGLNKLLDVLAPTTNGRLFAVDTEIWRPPPFHPLEKNFFLFWDSNNNTYAHYDMNPHRVFAKIYSDGTIEEELTDKVKDADAQCWKRHLDAHPLASGGEGENTGGKVHQATNSLKITMCKRSDAECRKNEKEKTYIMNIFQHKLYIGIFHATYEPYVMLFQEDAPFGIKAISEKPLWLRGRKDLNELLYIVSMNWKTRGQMYHGYLDDPLFANFGIEDSKSGTIDVTAEELLGPMMWC